MITQEQRDSLKRQMIYGDLTRAVSMYKRITGRQVSKKLLEKFLTGERKCAGLRPGSHDPIKMYEAISLTIRERYESQERMQRLADKILASTMEVSAAAAVQ